MKNNLRVFIISMILAFLIVSFFSSLSGEISTLGLLPGFMLNWFIEQLIIEILNEPYFMLGDYSFILNFFFYLTGFFLSSKILLISLNASRKSESQVLK